MQSGKTHFVEKKGSTCKYLSDIISCVAITNDRMPFAADRIAGCPENAFPIHAGERSKPWK